MDSSQQNSMCTNQIHKVVITNKHNEKLIGMLHKTESREVVVLCHGYNSNRENKILCNLASSLEKQGITSFRFDFSGSGESQGDFNYGNYIREADDLHSVIQHFSNNTNLIVTTILGHNIGGNIVLLYASKYRVPNVVNISGRYDLKKGIRLGEGFMEKISQLGFIDAKEGKTEYRVTQESLMHRLNTDMHQACLEIDRECNVLTVHGSDDKVVPAEDAKEFEKIIPNHKLEVVKGANHGYTKHQNQLISIVIEFIKTSHCAKNN